MWKHLAAMSSISPKAAARVTADIKGRQRLRPREERDRGAERTTGRRSLASNAPARGGSSCRGTHEGPLRTCSTSLRTSRQVCS
jgi:hypothetical protein